MKFKNKLSVLILILVGLVSAMALAGIVTNIVMIFEVAPNVLKIIIHVLLALCCGAILGVGLSIIFKSYYKIDKGILIKTMGVFKEYVNLAKVTEICRFTDKHALVLYDDVSYIVVNIPESDFDKFITAIREVNPDIAYDCKSDK